MVSILDIFRINDTVLFFAYGQVFFTLGVVIALHSRKHSRLALAHHLRWLAAFGMVHGVYEWGHAFIPLQAVYLSADAVAILEGIRTGLLVMSFYLLTQFGTLVACGPCKRPWLLRMFPAALLFAWLVLSSATNAVELGGYGIRIRLPEATDLARVMLGFTGAALAGFGMVRQAHIVASMDSQRISWYFRWSGLWFGLYAIVAGLIASRGQWIPIALSSFPLFSGSVPIPPPVLRSIAGLGVAFGVIRGLSIFELETDRFMEERDELQRYAGVRTHLLARVIGAQEEERKRVARELHDETGQSLSAVIMGLGVAAEALHRDATKAGAILADVREVAVQTLEGVREIILGLRPAILDDLGLAPALRRIAVDLGKRSSVRIEVFANDVDERLPPEVETVLFRILQEGMNNVARHSKARGAVLRLVRSELEVEALLEDDGVGFDPAEATAHVESGCGLGIVGMRERALLLGGAVVINSAPGRGTSLIVRIPLVAGN